MAGTELATPTPRCARTAPKRRDSLPSRPGPAPHLPPRNHTSCFSSAETRLPLGLGSPSLRQDAAPAYAAGTGGTVSAKPRDKKEGSGGFRFQLPNPPTPTDQRLEKPFCKSWVGMQEGGGHPGHHHNSIPPLLWETQHPPASSSFFYFHDHILTLVTALKGFFLVAVALFFFLFNLNPLSIIL